eukprot:4161524-Prymnesium_polylepis.1
MLNNDFLAESANINELVEEAEGMNILTSRHVRRRHTAHARWTAHAGPEHAGLRAVTLATRGLAHTRHTMPPA